MVTAGTKPVTAVTVANIRRSEALRIRTSADERLGSANKREHTMGAYGAMAHTFGRGSTRRTPRRGIAAIAAATLAATSLALVGAPAGAAVLGKANKSGTLTVEAPGVLLLKKGSSKFTEAKSDAKIKTGDTVQTNETGLAEIGFPDGSLTRLDHNTVFTLEKLASKTGDRQVEGTVSAGQTWNRVQKLSESDTFEQKGNGATAAVLGTSFVTKCNLPTGVAFKVVKTKKALRKLQKASSCDFTLIDGKLKLSSANKVVGVARGQSVEVNATGEAGNAETVAPDILFTDQWILKNLAADAKAGKSEAGGQATTEDLKQARIEGSWPVNLTVTQSAGFRNLDATRNRTYTFTGSCNGNACSVTLSRETANGTRVIPLTFADGVYTGTDPDLGTQNCVLDDGTVSVPNGIKNSGTVSFSPTSAVPDSGLWRATGLAGTVTETATQVAGAASQCQAGTATFSLIASR